MRDLLHLIFEYRRLLAKSEAVAGTLRPRTLQRLEALEKLFGKEPSPSEKLAIRRHARCQIDASATLRLTGRVQPVKVVNLGGGGVCISPAPNVPAGQTALLRILSEDNSRVYQYQVRASWAARTKEGSHMGMPFVGVPREIPIGDDYAQIVMASRRAAAEAAAAPSELASNG